MVSPVYESMGSVEGRLVVDKLGRRCRYIVVTFLDETEVTCILPTVLTAIAKKLLGKRVAVYGNVLSREDGSKFAIEVDEIQELPDEIDLLTISEIAGILAKE